MDKAKRIIVFALMPALASAANFQCVTDGIGRAAGPCCRESEEFGLSMCNYGSPRDLLFTFEIPTVQGRYGVLAPDPDAQHGGNRSILCGMLIGAILSFVIYHTILSPKAPRFIKDSTFASILLGLVLAPCYYVDMFNVQSSAVRWPFILSTFLFLLRTAEAYFGFTPEGAKKSFWMYCTYFALPVELQFDAKTSNPIKATRRDALQSLWRFTYTLFTITLLFSFLCHYEYMPFGRTKAGQFDETAELRDYFDPRHLGNSFFIGWWFQQTLAYGDAAMGLFMHSLIGLRITPMMDSPIFKATSPSDFWSKRWNVLVHSLLKRGIYKPFRSLHFSVFAATFATFVLSGLMHEWINHVGFVYHRTEIPDDSYYKPSNIAMGSNFFFFAYGLIPIAIEKSLSKVPSMKRLGRALPRLLRWALVLMTTLPVASLFASPYYHGRMFVDYEALMYTVFKME